ncbi:MAG: helix-turn-helix transcriptional regulator [Bdellovibrio sp.]
MKDRARIDKIPIKHRRAVETQLRQIAVVIQQRREEMGLTQEQLAEILGLTVVALGYIEQGRRFPSLPFLFYICRVMDIPIKLGV